MVCAMASLGCRSFSHGEAAFTAKSARVPISLTAALIDANGLVPASRIHHAGAFRWESDGCVDAKLDISSAVNQQVERVNGDAIILLQVESRPSSDCVEVHLTGEIVRVDR